MIYNNIPKYNDYEKLQNSTIEHKRDQVSWIGKHMYRPTIDFLETMHYHLRIVGGHLDSSCTILERSEKSWNQIYACSCSDLYKRPLR